MNAVRNTSPSILLLSRCGELAQARRHGRGATAPQHAVGRVLERISTRKATRGCPPISSIWLIVRVFPGRSVNGRPAQALDVGVRRTTSASDAALSNT